MQFHPFDHNAGQHALPRCRTNNRNALSALLATLLIFANPAHAAEEWLALPINADNITFSIDKGNLERSGKLVRFWEKITYTKATVMDQASGMLIKEKKIRRIMNCAEKTQGLLHGVTYGEQGKFITSITLDEAQTTMTAIPQDTVAAAEFAVVCAPPPPSQN